LGDNLVNSIKSLVTVTNDGVFIAASIVQLSRQPC